MKFEIEQKQEVSRNVYQNQRIYFYIIMFLYSVFKSKHCWPVTVSGEISFSKKMLTLSVMWVEKNLIFSNEAVLKNCPWSIV